MKSQTKIRYAVIPAAGFGSRLLPATKSVPKEMITIVDRPAIDYVIAEAFAAGIEHVIVVLGRNKQPISNHFDRHPELEETLNRAGKQSVVTGMLESLPEAGQVSFVRQHEALGLGHAIRCARKIIDDEYFAVLLPDMLYPPGKNGLIDAVQCYERFGCGAVSVMKKSASEISNYGVIDFLGKGFEDDENSSPRHSEIANLVEKPAPADAPSLWAVSGRYVLPPQIFDKIAETKPGSLGEIQLTDAMQALLQSHKLYAVTNQSQVYDCGTAENFITTNIAFALARPDLRDKVHQLLKRFSSDSEQ